MKISEQNEGKKVSYSVTGTTIIIDDTISINLSKYQKDQENVIDVCLDADMQLTTGLGKYYVANIIIPLKEYSMVDTGVKDDKGNEIYDKVAESLNMDDVTLVLWALPYGYEGGTN